MYKRIRELREDADLTQKEVSKILHCSQQVYSNYELGQRDIPTDILIKLSEIYHVCHVPVKRHTKYLRIIHTMHSHLAADEPLTETTSSRKSSVLCSI